MSQWCKLPPRVASSCALIPVVHLYLQWFLSKLVSHPLPTFIVPVLKPKACHGGVIALSDNLLFVTILISFICVYQQMSVMKLSI